MDDIVERLRRKNDEWKKMASGWILKASSLGDPLTPETIKALIRTDEAVAIAEITRLRAELEQTKALVATIQAGLENIVRESNGVNKGPVAQKLAFDLLALTPDDMKGCVVVPREPTKKMFKAAFAAMNDTPSGTWKRMKAEKKKPREIFDAKMAPRYRAMINAAQETE